MLPVAQPLADAGTAMTAREKLKLLAIIDDFVFGYALREGANDPAMDFSFAKSQLNTGAFPGLVEVFGKGRLPAIPRLLPNSPARVLA